MPQPKSVDARAVSLDQLLDRVQNERAPVRVTRNGRAIAEITPIEDSAQQANWHLVPVVESLKPVISTADALAPLNDEDWPSEARP